MMAWKTINLSKRSSMGQPQWCIGCQTKIWRMTNKTRQSTQTIPIPSSPSSAWLKTSQWCGTRFVKTTSTAGVTPRAPSTFLWTASALRYLATLNKLKVWVDKTSIYLWKKCMLSQLFCKKLRMKTWSKRQPNWASETSKNLQKPCFHETRN